jgi:hypothetical protein
MHFNSTTSFNANVGTSVSVGGSTGLMMLSQNYVYLRVDNDGTNTVFSVSPTGQDNTWFLVLTETIAGWLTAAGTTYVGLCADSFGTGGVTPVLICDWFRNTPYTAVVSSYPIYSTVLLHFDGTNGQTTTVDSSQNAWTCTRNASGALSTTQVKFGTASLGNTTAAASNGFKVGPTGATGPGNLLANDFTIDFWFYATAFAAGENVIASIWDGTTTSWAVTYNSSSHFAFYYNGGFPTFSGAAVATGAWHHFAIVRSGTKITAYLDGTQYGTPITIGTTSINVNTTSPLAVGYIASSAAGWQGYIDEFRLVNGLAIWTSNFTPPVSAYTQ